MRKYIEKTGIKGLLGDSHRYETGNGLISLVHPCRATMDMFEIYCIEGDLFDDIERFDTLEQAEERIYELLVIDLSEYDWNPKGFRNFLYVVITAIVISLVIGYLIIFA